jgi:peptidoglycan/LPS O-acetylase OafA/YrhL
MRIQELDGLRGIAVLTVVYSHYFGYTSTLGGLSGTGAKNGWLGVDLFFILSGFLITSILIKLREQEHYFAVFYKRRALRIFPPYFLAIAVYLAASLWFGKPGSVNLWLQYIFYYTSLYLGTPKELDTAVILPVQLGLGVLWSLSVEELYYTFWAPIVRYTSKKGFTAVLMAVIVVAPLLRWWLHDPGNSELYTFYCRMDALVYGSVLALLMHARGMDLKMWQRFDRLFDFAAVVMAVATVILWTILHGDRSKVLLCTVGLMMADITFALFAFAILRKSGSSAWWMRALRAKWLRSVGMVSYSLYLFHYPLWSLVRHYVQGWPISYVSQIIVQALLSLILSFALAYGLWYGMESRILKWKDRRVPSPAHP